MTSLEITPGAEHFTDESGTIWVSYKENITGPVTVVTAKASMDIDYDEIISDAPIPNSTIKSTTLTQPNEEIAAKAASLADNSSSLRTIAKLTDWVYSSVDYDGSYWNKLTPAVDVFKDRKGICIQHTHLFISMAQSLGFETRYVSGYVFTDEWQPHSWAEVNVPGQGWVSADPTFGHAGMLGDHYVAISYGEDQLSAYDVLLSRNNDPDLEVSDKLHSNFSSTQPNDVILTIDIDNTERIIDVSITNNRPGYTFGSYQFLIPNSYGRKESSIMLLAPDETIHRYYGLNNSLFQDSYSYDIPLTARFNGITLEKTVKINGKQQKTCLPLFVVFLLFIKSWR